MQSIATKYIGPSNCKGARIKAIASGGAYVFEPYHHEYDPDRNHREAVRKLCHKLGWKGHMVAGATTDGTVNVFVNEPVIDQSFIVP